MKRGWRWAVCLGLCLAFVTALAGPAFADTIVIDDGFGGAGNPGFESDDNGECGADPTGQYAWHFVLVGLDKGTPAGILTAVFEESGVVIATGSPNPQGTTQDFYVYTDVPDTLVTASVVMATLQTGTPHIVLSHIAWDCVVVGGDTGGGDTGGGDTVGGDTGGGDGDTGSDDTVGGDTGGGDTGGGDTGGGDIPVDNETPTDADTPAEGDTPTDGDSPDVETPGSESPNDDTDDTDEAIESTGGSLARGSKVLGSVTELARTGVEVSDIAWLAIVLLLGGAMTRSVRISAPGTVFAGEGSVARAVRDFGIELRTAARPWHRR